MLLLVACGCSASKQNTSNTLVIFAAASLERPFVEILDAFRAAHPNLEVLCQFAGSNQLAHQIREGAPADVFASANQDYIDGLGDLAEPTRSIARNRLVLAFNLHTCPDFQSPQDLLANPVTLVLASPDVPAGRYAREVLTALELWPDLEPQVVSWEESVVGVTTKLLSGEVDGGFLYRTEARSLPQDAFGILALPQPEALNLHYPVSCLAQSSNSRSAEVFIQFLLSPKAQKIFRQHGFESP